MRIFALRFLFIFLTVTASAQLNNDIVGDWVKYDIDMKDGSPIINSIAVSNTSYVNYKISDRQIISNNNPVEPEINMVFPYYIKGHHIVISAFSKFRIEKNQNDTLIISQDNGESDGMSFRYHFQKKEMLQKIAEAAMPKSDTLSANVYCTPVLKSGLKKKLVGIFSGKKKYVKINGTLFINTENQTITTSITESEEATESEIKSVKKITNGSYKLWDLKEFVRYKIIKLPFSIVYSKIENFESFTLRFF